MIMPQNSTIASWVASVRHAAYRLEECYCLELADNTNDDNANDVPPFSVSDLDKIMVLTAGLPQSFEPFVVSISNLPIKSISFEDIVTRLLNEEGRQLSLHQAITPPAVPKPPKDPGVAHLVCASEKPGSRTGGAKHAPRPSPAGIRCHKCGGVGHYRYQCPSLDLDTKTDPPHSRSGQANAIELLDEFDDETTFVGAAHTVVAAW
jgi:hypothetical protein